MAESTQSFNEKSNEEIPKRDNAESQKPTWAGNKAREFDKQSIRERTFTVRLPTQFSAKEVLASVNGIILKNEVETVSRQSIPGNWTIVTKSTESAEKLIMQDALTSGPEHEKYRIRPRAQRATLLTLPFVDPEMTNTELYV